MDSIKIIMAILEIIMANTATLSIKTDPETKAIIQRAAEEIGLSVNAFVLMVAKNAAESDEIVIHNSSRWERESIEEWEASGKQTISSEEFKKEFGLD
ncbi:MAG: DUF1778 domain-containing protein [Coriobacteriales bacterium]|jgi:antitoxin component of RelBE/YafQ-DinJ toxin-antitoxin module|nr:DUF1778 domain-containing protein [Coriobacteriales bacterium]